MFFPACAVVHKYTLFAYKLLGRRSGTPEQASCYFIHSFYCIALHSVGLFAYIGLYWIADYGTKENWIASEHLSSLNGNTSDKKELC